jgi:hypothetical protein
VQVRLAVRAVGRDVVEVHAVAALPLGEEVRAAERVERVRVECVVELERQRAVLVDVPRRVIEIEPVAVQVLAPVVVRVDAADLERHVLLNRNRHLALAGPAAQRVVGQRIVEQRVRRAIALPAPLTAHVERAPLALRHERTAQVRAVDVVVVHLRAGEVAAVAAEVVGQRFDRAAVLGSAFLGHDVHDARHDAAVFRVEAAIHDDHLLDGVIVDARRRVACQWILLREAVDVVRGLVGAPAANDQRRGVLRFAIDRALEVDDARLLGRRVLVAARGETVDLVARQESRRAGRVGLDERTLGLDVHFIELHGFGVERNVERRGEVRPNRDAVGHVRRVAEQIGLHRDVTRGNADDGEVALIVAHTAEPLRGDANVHAGEWLLLLVDDLARQRSGRAAPGGRCPYGQDRNRRDQPTAWGADHALPPLNRSGTLCLHPGQEWGNSWRGARLALGLCRSVGIGRSKTSAMTSWCGRDDVAGGGVRLRIML